MKNYLVFSLLFLSILITSGCSNKVTDEKRNIDDYVAPVSSQKEIDDNVVSVDLQEEVAIIPSINCSECPSYSPPAPGWCDDGIVVGQPNDECGCYVPPVCEKNNNICAGGPTITDGIGRDVYPIDEKYSKLEFLGQIFTADDCGGQRINEISGVKNGQYTLGSTIQLNADPNQNLINLFETIGYTCSDSYSSTDCREWMLRENIDINTLLKIKPYYQIFERDDCVKCG